MNTSAGCTSYQRCIAGDADDLISISSTLIDVDNGQAAEGCDDPDIRVAMKGRKVSNRVRTRPSFPTMKPRHATARRFTIIPRTRNHRQSAFCKLECRFCKWAPYYGWSIHFV